MKVLSGLQPWWAAILSLGKRIENRGPASPVAKTKYRGPILLHASAGDGGSHYMREALGWMRERKILGPLEILGGTMPLPRGGIVGRAHITDVVAPDVSDEMFAMLHPGIDLRWRMPGQYGIVLSCVEPLPFVRCKGALGLWEAPADVVKQLGLEDT